MQTKTWRLGMDFYEMLGERDLNQRNMAMTVLEGEYLGEKALFADDKPVWTSEKRDFFRYICRRLKSRNIRKRR